uniref:Myocardial zonula adherens protein-like isoform X2 n=1 Tax=Petromyzon marinus TaxID=7757 RepID=A0AAJ7T435_PETMA|nr:myocardial zonula adherens protein-like isoform X2 [Petromyzon marinus]
MPIFFLLFSRRRCSREVKRLSLYKKSAASAERELRSVECDRRDQLPLGSHAAAAAAASSSSSQLTTAACAAAPETAAGSSVGSSVGSSAGHGQQMRARLAVSPLRTETRTDHEARASLEQARGHVSHDCELMTQKITKLSHQLKVNQEHQRDLSSELSKKNSMMHEYLNINSTLQETTIDLQRALTDTTLGNCRLQEEVRSLSESNARGLRELQECEARLRTAQRRGQTLQLQVEACQAANESVIRETTRRLYGEYYAQLTQQESQHRTHVADFLARQMEYEARLQRADEAREDTERTLAESQRRSRELERLLSGLQDERELFLRRQEEVESELSLIQARPSGSQGEKKRCEQLEGEVACLHEKIRHLNGIIISQDRKIKGVLEKVERLQWELQQKDAMISNLQQKVATLEAENAALKRRLEEQSRAAKTSERSTPNLSIPSYQPHLPPALTRRQWSVESSSENGDSPLARLRKLRASRIQPGPGSKEAERND